MSYTYVNDLQIVITEDTHIHIVALATVVKALMQREEANIKFLECLGVA